MGAVSAATLSTWDLTTDDSASNTNTNVIASKFTFSDSITNNGFSEKGANAIGWEANIIPGKYFEVKISPKADYTLVISDVDFFYNSTADSASFELNYSKENNFANPEQLVVKKNDVSATEKPASISKSIQVNSGETLTLRWFGYDFDPSDEFLIRELVIQGEANPIACDYNNPDNNLKIKDIDFTNNGFSHVEFGDDDEWFPLDDIEVQIEIENNGNEKIEDITVEWGLYDTVEEQWVIDLDEEDDFNLKDGKSETLTINFNLEDELDIDLEDLSDGDNYKFYVKAVGYDNEAEEYICEINSEDVSIVIEDDFVVVADIEMLETVSCDTELQISAKVWNIGDSDQEDVYVVIYNKDLGINERIEIGDVDAFDNEKLDVLVSIPSDAEEKYYSLYFWVYDEDNEVYENDHDEDEAEFVLPLNVEGNCKTTPKVVLSATLDSEAKAGKPLVIKATITNLGDTLSTFDLNVADYSSWADNFKIDYPTIVVDAGESKEVLITFDVDKKTSGEKLFNINVLSAGELVDTQQVAVTIDPAQGFFTGNVLSNLFEGDNKYISGAVILNIILIIVIIIVAVRLARKQ